MRPSVGERKMAPKGEKCGFIGIPPHISTNTVNVLLVKTRYIEDRQAMK